MSKANPQPSSRASRWILILAVLGLATALILTWVARRDDPSTASGSKASKASKTRRGGHGEADPEAREHDRAAAERARRLRGGQVDRRRLAELLGRNGTGAHGEAGRGGDGRPGGRGSAGAGGDDEPFAEDPVFAISAKGIKGAIRARIEEIKECYNGWLAMDDTLGGKVVLAFTIEADPDGELARISNAEIQGSTMDHPGMERCVLVMAESLRFEAPEKGKVTVRYPFRFRPGPKAKD